MLENTKHYSLGLSYEDMYSLNEFTVKYENYSDATNFCLALNQNIANTIIINLDSFIESPFDLISAIQKCELNIGVPIILITNDLNTIGFSDIIKYKIFNIIQNTHDMIHKLKDVIYKIESNSKYVDLIHLNNEYSWDKKLNTLRHKEQTVSLTYHESELLSFLIKNKNMVVSKEDIFYEIFYDSDKEYNDYTIRNLIKNIRKKIKSSFLMVVYGIGYKVHLQI